MSWTPAQREAARQRSLAYHASRKASQKREATLLSDLGTPGVVETGGSPTPGGVGDRPLTVTVKADPTPKPKATLRERLGLGGAAKQATPAPAKRKPTGRKADKPNLVSTLLPTILASLIATYARDRLPEEYQPCAPSKQEVQAILGPLMDIIGRRVEVAAEVSQDYIDLANALICTFAYGARAYVTYVDIKKSKELGISYEQKQQQRHDAYQEKLAREVREYESVINEEPTLYQGLRAYQAQNNGTSVPHPGVNGAGPNSPDYGPVSNGPDNADDAQQLRDAEAAQVANLFKRDREGRVQLGLLPRTV